MLLFLSSSLASATILKELDHWVSDSTQMFFLSRPVSACRCKCPLIGNQKLHHRILSIIFLGKKQNFWKRLDVDQVYTVGRSVTWSCWIISGFVSALSFASRMLPPALATSCSSFSISSLQGWLQLMIVILNVTKFTWRNNPIEQEPDFVQQMHWNSWRWLRE